MKDRDSRLYETIDDIEAKLKKLELSQAKRDDELSNMRQKLCDKQVGLRDHDAPFVPSSPLADGKNKQAKHLPEELVGLLLVLHHYRTTWLICTKEHHLAWGRPKRWKLRHC